MYIVKQIKVNCDITSIKGSLSIEIDTRITSIHRGRIETRIGEGENFIFQRWVIPTDKSGMKH